MKTILIIEDEENICRIIEDYMSKEGYGVLSSHNGKDGLELIEQEHFELAILDVMLPHIDGWTLCRKIKDKGNIPVIFLTARGEEYDELMGFELGADDYMKKPFSPAVLVARVNKQLKLKGTEKQDRKWLIRESLEIDIEGRKVKLDGAFIELTNKEFQILLYLIENENRVLSREMILNHIWGYDFLGDTRVVDNHIKKIRKALGEYAYFIRTVFGAGYVFEV